MVTESELQCPLEASPVSPIAFLFRQIAPHIALLGAFRALASSLRLSAHLSFQPPLLSAPTVSIA